MDNHSLKNLLNGLNRDFLQKIASAHGLETPPKKSALVEQLHRHLGVPRVVAHSLAALSPATRTVFERLRQHHGRSKLGHLRSELERDGLVCPRANGGELLKAKTADARATFDDALWPLLECGLVFVPAKAWTPVQPQTLTYDLELVIPPEVLAASMDRSGPLHTLHADAIEQSEDSSAANFQRDVYLYWNYLRDETVTLTAMGCVPKRHLVKLNELMIVRDDVQRARSESDMGRLHFIRLMIEETGLAKLNGKRLEPSASAPDFFSYTLTRRTDRFFEAWKKSSHWNELLRLPIRPRRHEDRGQRTAQLVARAREYILELIRTHAAEGWLGIDELVQTARTGHYEFLFKRTREDFGPINPYYYFHNPLGWGFPVADESEGWEKVESEFIRSIVREPLHWLGLVTLGYRDGELIGFRLTALGAYLFGLSMQAPLDEMAATSGRVVVQPNFQIFALEPIAEQTLASLDRFADRVKADRVFEYHLSRQSLYRAQQNGMPVQEVIAFLQQAATAPLPQNVQRTLEEWGDSYRRIIIRKNVSLLHARDPQLIDQLASGSAAASLLLSRPLPRVALVSGDPAARAHLLATLIAQGQLPAFTQDGTDTQHSLSLDEDGKVSFRHAMPNIFLLQAVEHHAERRADGYYLTEAAVQAGRDAGQSLDEIIARWQYWHHGPLPTAMLEKIKHWGRFE